MISPAAFIPLAEETGLIISIGEWVLQTACNQTKIWQKAGFFPFQIAVNLSRRQFMQRNLQERIIKIIQEVDLKPNHLELEVTENLVMQNKKTASRVMKAWQKYGIKISIDDFGTGYSSLSYLHQFPINSIKIDRSFVSKLDSDTSGQTLKIVSAIIKLGHNLGLEIVAEGIETQAQMQQLKELQCNKAVSYTHLTLPTKA